MATTYIAHATLFFNFDFRQDGIYESSWPLKAGEAATLDIYVSNVPQPGLRAMGFKLAYDSNKLQVVPAGTEVYAGNWSVHYIETGTPGIIHMAGFRTGSGLSGDAIKLGTVTFQCKQTGTGELRLLDRGQTVDCFVLTDGSVLDGEFPDGVFSVAEIRPPIPGDVNGDKVVDLGDAVLVFKFMSKLTRADLHANADVNGDGKIGLAEAAYILQRVAGLRQ